MGSAELWRRTHRSHLRCGIDGLAVEIELEFNLNPFNSTLSLFCGRRRDWMKALYWDSNGFVLLYKRLESGSFQWPCKGFMLVFRTKARKVFQRSVRLDFFMGLSLQLGK